MKKYYRFMGWAILVLVLLMGCVFAYGWQREVPVEDKEKAENMESKVTNKEEPLPEPTAALENEVPAVEVPTVTPAAVESVEMASPHFEMREYRCDCAGYCDGWPARMHPELLEKIEALRCGLGCPVIITSGVRCELRNEEVGGVAWSFHKRGYGADLYCPGVSVGVVTQLASDVGLNVLPYYGSGYVHVEIV